ncbi:MAG: hypothetical protein ACTSYS_11595 [Promethearchaeota archaeon]
MIGWKNDGKSTWKDKHSISSIDKLGIITRLYEKTSLETTSQRQDDKT